VDIQLDCLRPGLGEHPRVSLIPTDACAAFRQLRAMIVPHERPGPYEAIEAVVAENPDFEVDRSQEARFISWNPKGFLKCRGPTPA